MTGRKHIPSGFAVRFLAGCLSLTLLAAAVAGLSLARDPDPKKADAPSAKAPDKAQRPPEEEDPDAKPVKTHKVAVDDPDDPDAKSHPAPRAVDLQQAAKDAKHFAVRKLFLELAVPHDVVYRQYSTVANQNVVPIPDYIGKNTDAIVEPFKVAAFPSNSWTPEAPAPVKRSTVVSVKPYEELAEEKVDEFLGINLSKSADPQTFLSRYDQDVAAEQALTAVLLFHQSAKERGGRRGPAWGPVEDSLKQKLLGVLLEELNALVEADNWDAAFALTNRLAETYKGQQDRDRIAAPLTGRVKQTLIQGTLNEDQKVEARLRLRQLQDLFPQSKGIDEVTDLLHEQAKSLFEEAKQEKNPDRVGRLLNEAEQAWPALPGLRAYRLERSKEHPTLRVGVRELPARISPALAVTDSDLRAVELVFESLMKLAPDGAGGGRWEPALAEGRPRLTPRGRQFRLPENACWSDGQLLRATDFRTTVRMLKAGRFPNRPPVWADLLDDVNVVDPLRVNLSLGQGWLDPLAPMNFMVVPSGSEPDSPKFAEHPLGSGPFVYGGTGTKDGRPCAYFTANPYYGARADKSGLPHIDEGLPYIKEVRFFLYKEPVEDEFRGGRLDRLDLILDLTAKEAAALAAKGADLRLRQPPAVAPNRRVYFLAVNHRKPALANAAFRCALACAVNREAILDDAFRAAPGQDLHTPLNGPYPAKSWACNPDLVRKHGDKVTLDPFNVEGAKAKKAQAAEAGARDVALSLKYPSGDPAVESAMKQLCAQVRDAIGVTLTPEAVPAAELHKDVEETHNYDLAYYHYDYPDDVYWLGPLLDPRGGAHGQNENYLGYNGGEKGGLIPLIQDDSRRRDFEQVRERTHILHDRFLNEEMPFIPLWQLDPLVAVHNDVVAPPFDPLLVFTDVEEWKLDRK